MRYWFLVLLVLILLIGQSAHATEKYLNVPVSYVSDRWPFTKSQWLKLIRHVDDPAFKKMLNEHLHPEQAGNKHHLAPGLIHILEVGHTTVSIPSKEQTIPDSLSAMGCTLATAPCSDDPKGKIMLRSSNWESLYESPAFAEFLDEVGNQSPESKLVVYLHGCCASRYDALRDGAEMQRAFAAPLIVFDWASPDFYKAPLLPEINMYRLSERSLDVAQADFNEFMRVLIKRMPTRKFVLLAHSMSARLLMNYLLQAPPTVSDSLSDVFFVRGDMDLVAFLLQEKQLAPKAQKFNIIWSKNDSWLKHSQDLSLGKTRLGYIRDYDDKLAFGSAPNNFYFWDVTSLKMQHFIPVDLLSAIQRSAQLKGSNYAASKIDGNSFSVAPLTQVHSSAARTSD
jgi:esterase/lipase superfamily enzyme